MARPVQNEHIYLPEPSVPSLHYNSNKVTWSRGLQIAQYDTELTLQTLVLILVNL